MKLRPTQVKLFIFALLLLANHLFAQDKIRIGVIPFKSDAELKQTFQGLADWLKKATAYEVEIQYLDKDELGYLLSKGKIDLGVFRPLVYLNAKEEFPELEVSLTHLVNGKESYSGYVLVNPSSNINNLQDLNGKRFTFIKPSSTSGYLIPLGVLREKGIDAEKLFSSVDFSFSHQRSIEMLQSGETDGIAVSDEDLDQNSYALMGSFKMLTSFQVPNAAYVFAPELDETVKRKLMSALTDARRNPAARGMLNNPMHINGWIKVNDDLYNPLRRYMGIDRVKPSVQVIFQLSDHAASFFEKKGDLLDVLKRRLITELKSSKRFTQVDEVYGAQKAKLIVELSQLEEGYFNYHVLWNDDLLADADIDEASLTGVLPPMVRYAVLSNLNLLTQLTFDGNQWFIPYGLKDGINAEDYKYYVRTSTGMQTAEILSSSDLNTVLKSSDMFTESDLVNITYTRLDLLSTGNEGNVTTTSSTLTEFWEDDFWDKFGLLVSICLAATSGLITWYFSTRKKRNFKKVLRDANQLLEAYVQDSNRMKTSMIEIKDAASQMLENGEITENQFLIIKHRLDEIEQQIREQQLKG